MNTSAQNMVDNFFLPSKVRELELNNKHIMSYRQDGFADRPDSVRKFSFGKYGLIPGGYRFEKGG